MRTIPRHYPHDYVRPGERQAMCAYCDGRWYRSEMRRDPSGHLTCPDCDDGGRDTVTLDRARATGAASGRPPVSPTEDW